MGCDIHLYVETMTLDRKWQFREDVEGYWGRNYDLFAMLADVRNGYGFAGVDTGDPLEPISAPRGIPSDASPEYARIAGPYVPCPDEARDLECTHDFSHGGWGEDGHSHTWFTAKELHGVDWDGNGTINRGWVGPEDYLAFLASGKPSGWSGGISGKGVQHVTNEEMERLIGLGQASQSGWTASHYTQVEWKETWRSAAGEAWFAFLDSVNRLTMDDGSDVRVCMFFDN